MKNRTEKQKFILHNIDRRDVLNEIYNLLVNYQKTYN